MSVMRLVQVYMPDSLRDAVRHESYLSHMTVTSFIRVAVEEKLGRLARQRKAKVTAVDCCTDGEN